jgi:hypothetical protein
MALECGCLVLQVPRPLFLAFVAHHPGALLLYLQQVCAGRCCLARATPPALPGPSPKPRALRAPPRAVHAHPTLT